MYLRVDYHSASTARGVPAIAKLGGRPPARLSAMAKGKKINNTSWFDSYSALTSRGEMTDAKRIFLYSGRTQQLLVSQFMTTFPWRKDMGNT